MFRTEAERRAYYKGIRASIAWLHAEALKMNDPHARAVLNCAGFHLGLQKPNPAESNAHSPSEASAGNLPPDDPMISAAPPFPLLGDEKASRTMSGGTASPKSDSAEGH